MDDEAYISNRAHFIINILANENTRQKSVQIFNIHTYVFEQYLNMYLWEHVSFSTLTNKNMDTSPSTPLAMAAANVHESCAVTPITALSVEDMLNQKNQLIRELQERNNLLTDTNTALFQKCEAKEKKNAYWFQMVRNMNTVSSKKGRSINLDPALKKAMRDSMNAYVFHRMKFCPNKYLHSIDEGSLGETIMKNLNVPIDNYHVWWAANHEMAESLLVEHRTSAAQSMKTSFNKGKQVFMLLYHSK